MADDKGVLVYGECVNGGLAAMTLELLGIGRKLADDLGEELAAVLLGEKVSDLAEEAIRFGADKVYVMSFSGDGGTVDIGLQAISGAAERGESMMWICYDNEAYMNTGIQRSSSTPMFADTTSTPVGSFWSGKSQRRKNMVLIMAAHRIPYIATASLAYLPDLERKIRKAADVTRAGKGLAYVHIQQPCATGWHFPPEKTVEVGRLAVQTGAWPLLEVDDGVLEVNIKPKELKPIEEYLSLQRRFHHVMKEQVKIIQKEVDKDWKSWLNLEKMGKLPWY